MTNQTLKLDQIVVDNSLNPREGALDQIAVMEYAANVDDLPAMTAYQLVDSSYLLVAGFHRIAAHRLAGRNEASFEVRSGSRLDAEEYADLDNLRHGIQLNRREKRLVIGRQLKRHPEWSDVRLGTACHTTDKTVRSVREEMEAASEIPRMDILTGADGISRPRTISRPQPVSQNDTLPLLSAEPLAEDPADAGAPDTGVMQSTAPAPAPAMALKPLPEADPLPEKPPMKLEMSPAAPPDLIVTLRIKMDRRLDVRPVLVSIGHAGEAPLIMRSVDYASLPDDLAALLAEHGPAAIPPGTEAVIKQLDPVPEAAPEWLE